MVMPNEKNLILLLYLEIIFLTLWNFYNLIKGRSFYGSYLKNTKPQSIFCGFDLNKPKNPFVYFSRVAFFWLNLGNQGLK